MTKSHPVLATMVFFIFTGALVAQNEPQYQPQYGKSPERTITANPGANNPVTGIDETDKNFLKNASIGDEAEIQLGQMAQAKASSAAVKSFGERMIKDHSSADDKLKGIAKSQHVSLPVKLDPAHKDKAEALARLSGPQFDKAYMALMVEQHTKDVSQYRGEATNAHDATVKQFAAATLPTLQSHLQEAQQVEQQVKDR